jgi:hypothetical protein
MIQFYYLFALGLLLDYFTTLYNPLGLSSDEVWRNDCDESKGM